MINFTTSQNGIELIAAHEGCRLTAYQDSGKVWTIGYGHTMNVYEGQTITIEQAKSFLAQDLKLNESYLNLINIAKNQNMFDALMDLIYNCGIGNFQKSELFKQIKINPCAMILKQYWWDTCVHDAKGEVLPGLLARRKDEYALYIKS